MVPRGDPAEQERPKPESFRNTRVQGLDGPENGFHSDLRQALSPANESVFPHLSWSPDSPPCVRIEGGGGGRQRQTKKQRKTTKGKEKIKEILFWVKIRTFKFSASTLGGGLISPLFISEQ